MWGVCWVRHPQNTGLARGPRTWPEAARAQPLTSTPAPTYRRRAVSRPRPRNHLAGVRYQSQEQGQALGLSPTSRLCGPGRLSPQHPPTARELLRPPPLRPPPPPAGISTLEGSWTGSRGRSGSHSHSHLAANPGSPHLSGRGWGTSRRWLAPWGQQEPPAMTTPGVEARQ